MNIVLRECHMNSEVGSNCVLWDSLKLKCLGPNASQMHQTLH